MFLFFTFRLNIVTPLRGVPARLLSSYALPSMTFSAMPVPRTLLSLLACASNSVITTGLKGPDYTLSQSIRFDRSVT